MFRGSIGVVMSPGPSGSGALVGKRLGKYEVLALLAIGGTSEIYLARIAGEAGFEKFVVIKCLHDHLADDSEFVRMFLDEARLGAQLDHSNIVQTLELGQDDDKYFMVMEYLAGMSLAMVVRKARHRIPTGRIPVDLVLGIAVQACAGLHYAHSRIASNGQPLQVVHRDISPQNLVISFEGMLKIVDFGIAKASQRETHTQSGTLKGKFAYMSPEHCLGKPVDCRTDVFALGTVVHELLTGQRLFKRAGSYETYQAILRGEVPRPSEANSELSDRLDDVVLTALAYDRDNRYASAEVFGEALTGILHERGKSVGANEWSRFFEAYFAREIDEHVVRMRELLDSGQHQANPNELAWGAGDEEPAAESLPQQPVGFPDNIATDQISASEQPADELPGESTRIELNPLERVRQIHEAEVGRDSQAAIADRDDSAQGDSEDTEDGDEATTIQLRPEDDAVSMNVDSPSAAVTAPASEHHSEDIKTEDLATIDRVSEAEDFDAAETQRNRHGDGESPPSSRGSHPTLSVADRLAAGPQPAGADKFLPVQTPTAFKELGAFQPPPPKNTRPSDLLLLANERDGINAPGWIIVIAFAVSAAVGLGVTLLLGYLFT